MEGVISSQTFLAFARNLDFVHSSWVSARQELTVLAKRLVLTLVKNNDVLLKRPFGQDYRTKPNKKHDT